jgi:2-polyprenyl-6-methoxyphenol hydroxylase-like FAD-dependent oxidoreductase
LPALDRAGIRTRELIYANRFGQVAWREPRGTDAGLDAPQFSSHRGKLHTALLDAVRERLGADALQTGHRLVAFTERGDRVEARFERRDGGETIAIDGDALVGADGIHSTARAVFYPAEGAPVWNGTRGHYTICSKLHANRVGSSARPLAAVSRRVWYRKFRITPVDFAIFIVVPWAFSPRTCSVGKAGTHGCPGYRLSPVGQGRNCRWLNR